MGDALRTAVVGVGHLGHHHARILAGLEGVTLTAVVDTNRERAAAIAAQHGCAALTHVSQLDEVDAVVVAVPTMTHREIAVPLLERKVAVLVEKPLAARLEDADAIIAAAQASGAVLSVGHTERHNPAVTAIMPFVTTPRFIEVHRLSAFPDRSLDIDVVFDLMIHDLDIILSMVQSEIVSVESVGVPVLTPKYDIANARLRFANRCLANVTASRISREQVRKIRVFQPDAYLSIDYAAQEAEGWRLVRRDGDRPTIEGGQLPIQRDEPLKRELVDFVEAIRTGRTPRVDGAAGRRALALANEIAARMESVA